MLLFQSILPWEPTQEVFALGQEQEGWFPLLIVDAICHYVKLLYYISIRRVSYGLLGCPVLRFDREMAEKRKVKVALYLEARQISELKKLAEARDSVMSKLIRRAIQEFIERENFLTVPVPTGRINESGEHLEMVVQNKISPKRRPRK